MSDPLTRFEGAPERRAWIMSRLQATGFLAINDVARELMVSHMTVRRDLHALEAGGDVRLVHGGVSWNPRSSHVQPFSDDGNGDGRARVAALAVEMVGSSDTIALDAGPTAFAVARALPRDFHGSVITHSMPVLHLLDERRPASRTVALGGELLSDRRAFVGPATEAAVGHLRARTFFLSPAAVDALGTYAQSPAEASVQRKLIEIADEVVLLATCEVYSTSAAARIAPLGRMSRVVTDRHLPREVGTALRRSGVSAHVVDE